MPVLIGVDILGIQSYVYTSNRLRDVLVASWMVGHVTSRDVLAQWGGAEDRVLLAAGGNAIVELDSREAAERWTAFYTRWLLDTAPGLDAVIAHQPYDNGRLAWALRAMQIRLARAKQERRPGVPQLGLGVTASCAVTGLPANRVDQGALVSDRIGKLREKVGDAKEVWKKYLPEALEHAPRWRPQFPDVVDSMGRTQGDTSLLGVVHIDGNQVGKAIEGWLEHCIRDEVEDSEVRAQYRDWSCAIDALGDRVLRAVVNRVAGCTSEDNGRCVVRGTPHDLAFRLADGSHDRQNNIARNEVLLPLRPILLGGDDLTFICDGRVALDLAVTALRQFDTHPVPHLGNDGTPIRLTACAGVALVKAHAPFRNSYQLAEELCRSAKTARKRDLDRHGTDSGCWIDWHIGSTRPGDSVTDIRDRQYRHNDKCLTMRPYPLGASVRPECWEWLDGELLGPGDSAETARQGLRGAKHWNESRNRVKLLSSLVSEGGSDIERQLDAWKVIEPALALPGKLDSSGFRGSQTPLLDAIELMDLHIRLEPHPREHDAAPDTATARTGNDKGRQQ